MAMSSAMIDIVDARQTFARAFIGAAATVMLGLAVAFVTGMMGKLDKIEAVATAQGAQGAQISALKESMDKRKDDSTAGTIALATIAEQHKYLIEESRATRSELAALRAELAAARKK